HPALASTHGAGGASLFGRCLACRIDRARSAAAGAALRDRKRGRCPAHGGAMVRVDRRHQARAGALSRRRAGAQRSHRRARAARIARVDAADPALHPHYKAGTLRLLAQSTEKRSPSLPDVPNYQEAGVKGLVLDQWLGVFVPVGTPPAIGMRLNREINEALAEATIREGFLQSGQ